MNKNRRRKSHNDPEEVKDEQYYSLQSSQSIVGHTYEGGQTGVPRNHRAMVQSQSDSQASGEEIQDSEENENPQAQPNVDLGIGNTHPGANGGTRGYRPNQSDRHEYDDLQEQESMTFHDQDSIQPQKKIEKPPEKKDGSPFRNIFNKFSGSSFKAEQPSQNLKLKQSFKKGSKKEQSYDDEEEEEPIELQASQVMNPASNSKSIDPEDMMGFFAPGQDLRDNNQENEQALSFARKDRKKNAQSSSKDVTSLKPPKAPKKVQFSMKDKLKKLVGPKNPSVEIKDDKAKNDANGEMNSDASLLINDRNTSSLQILGPEKKQVKQLEIKEQVEDHIVRQHVAKKRQEDRKIAELELQQKLKNQLRYSDSCLEQYPSLKDLFKNRVQFSKKQSQFKKRLEERHKIPIEETTQITINIRVNDYDANKKKKKQKLTYELDPELQDDAELTGWRKKRQDLEENLLTIKDDCTFYVHGRYIKYSNRSLGMLDNKNKLRIFLVWLINHKWFENFIITLIFCNSLLLGAKDYTDYHNETPINQFVERCEPFFTYVFLLECVSKILGMGFILGNKCYLNDAWNWLDFTVVVTSLLEFLPSMRNMSGLRTFRLFRPLRSLTTMPSMKLLIGTLFSSLSNLGGLMGLSLFFFMIFAILGVSLWHGRIHYRCYKGDAPILNVTSGLYTWEIDEQDERLCYDKVRECREGYTCGSVIDFTFNDGKYDRQMEDPDLWKNVQIRSLNYAITNFDHVGSAFLTIFQCITMEGWTHIMNIYEDTYMQLVVHLYFISCVVICSFFLLNLTIAVMLMKYEELDKKQTDSKHKEELRQLGIGFKLPISLIEFLIKQDSIQESPKAMRMIKQEESFLKQLFAPKRVMVDMSQPYYQNFVVQICQKIAINPFFEALIIFVIIINTACLAMDKFPELDEAIIQVLAQLNLGFTAIFTVEVILKMVGLGVREFVKEKFNQFDLAIVIVSIVEMQIYGDENDSGVFSACRAFRLFKIFKLFKVGDLRILIDSIAFTMTTISDYVILLLLFIYVFTLLGMSFFAGKLKFDEHDKYVPPSATDDILFQVFEDEDQRYGFSPRNNFDEVRWSLVLIFQILLSENWNYIMYDCIRTTGSLSAIYFIALVLGGNIIMLNLFLAILLGNFEKARNFGLKKKIFEAFREIMNGKKTLNQTLDIMLSDLSVHVKLKILKWDELMVQKIHQQGETEIAQDLMEIGGRFIKDESDDEEGFTIKQQKNKKDNIKTLEELKRIADEKEKKKKILELILEDENSEEEEISEQQEEEDSQKFGKESELKNSREVDDEANDQEAADNMQENSAEANQTPNKDDSNHGQMENANQKEIKLKFQFSKTIFKYHRMNPKLIRSRELTRQFNMDQGEAIKEILQKEISLQKQDMDIVTEEDMKTHIINQNKKFKDPLHGIKKVFKQQISAQRISSNIDRFRQQNIFATLDKEQAKISIQQQLAKDLFNKGRKQVRPQQNLLFSKGDDSPARKNDNSNGKRLSKYQSPSKDQELFTQVTSMENNEQKLSSLHSSSMEKSNQKGEVSQTIERSEQQQSSAKKQKPQNKGNQSLKKLTKKGEQLQKQATKDQTQLTPDNKAVQGLQAEDTNFQSEKQQKVMAQVQDKEKEDFERYVEENEILKRAIVEEEKPKPPTLWDKFVKRAADSSLFILHKNNWLRRKCMLLAESPENLDDLYAMDLKEKEEEERLMRELLSEEQSEPSEKGSNSQQNVTDMSNPNTKNKGGKGVLDLPQKKPQTYHGYHPSKIFENIVLSLITVSSLSLVLDNPLYDPDSRGMIVLAQVDSFFTFLFAIEASIKILAKGLLFNRMGPIEPYLINPWNMLDAFVVMASLMDFVFQAAGFDMAQLSALKALRAFRALRPLRMIARNEGMRLVVNALLASLPSMGNVLLVCSLFILIFAIMGVKFFKGKFNYCADLNLIFHDMSNASHYKGLIIDKYDCENYGGNWIPRDSNFDNTISAMSTLFQMTTTEGWVEVMFDGIDSTGVGLQPKEFSNPYLIIYFIAFMIIGSQFIINLFVGVVIDNFNTIKEREELGNMFVTEQQKSWIEIQKIGHMKNLRTKIDEPTDPTRQDFFKLVKDKRFEYTITFFICINTIFMAMKYHNMGPFLEDMSEYANFVFAFVFNAEMVLKLIGMGRTYFWDSWNKFDCFIVIATDIGLILNRFDIGGGLSTATTVIRGVRIMRIFRLIKSSVHIRLILDTIMNILPQIQNVMTLILLLLFIGAALAINLFSQVQHQRYLDEKNNFQSFPGSMIMLWKFSTGEGWNKFMYELANTKGYAGKECQAHQSYDDIQKHGVNGCGTVVSYPFFIAFTILVTMLILNLSIAAVIEGLDRAKKENMGIVAGDEIEYLIELWQEFDPFASGWISMQQLIFLLYLLPPPLGRRSNRISMEEDPNYDPDKQVQGLKQQDRYLVHVEKNIIMKKIDALELLRDLNIKVYKDLKHPDRHIHYVSVFKALIKRVYHEKQQDYKLALNLNRKMKGMWNKKYTEIASKETLMNKGVLTVRQVHAGRIILKWLQKCLSNQKNSRAIQKDSKNNGKKRKQEKVSAKKRKEPEVPKGDANKQKNKNKRQENLEQMAVILEDIVYQKYQNRNPEISEEIPEYVVKNMYVWKCSGGEKLHDDVLRQIADNEFNASDLESIDQEQKEKKEAEYKKYKEKRTKRARRQKRLAQQNLNLNDSKNFESTQEPFFVRRIMEVEEDSLDISEGSEDHDEVLEDSLSDIDVQEATDKINSIQINIGSLEDGQNKIEESSKQCFRINPDGVGFRPFRDWNAERYEKERYEKKMQKKLEDGITTVASELEYEPKMKDGKPVINYEYQENKIRKLQKLQKKQKSENQDKKGLMNHKQRPQINRNREDFEYGNSGQTIELDDKNPVIDGNAEGFNTDLAVKHEFQEDIVSQPILDKFYLPSKAIRKGQQQPEEKPKQRRRIGFVYDSKDENDANKSPDKKKHSTSTLLNQSTFVTRNNRALSTVKDANTLFAKLAPAINIPSTKNNNYFDQDDMLTASKASEIITEESSIRTKKMVLTAKNFPTDINIVDKTLHANLKQNLNANLIRQNTKQMNYQPLPLKERFAIVGALAGHGGPKFNMQMEEQKLDTQSSIQTSQQKDQNAFMQSFNQYRKNSLILDKQLTINQNNQDGYDDNGDNSLCTDESMNYAELDQN